MSALCVPISGLSNAAPAECPASALAQRISLHADTSAEERVTLLLVRDLLRLGWCLRSTNHRSIELGPPANYGKDVVRMAMAYARNAVIERNAEWVDAHIDLARANVASGEQALESPVCPRIVVCDTRAQNDLFRIFRYSWSSPPSDYVGRRIRLLIRDDGVSGSPVIGIAALGSSIIHIPKRDKWIGWDTSTRTERIVYAMDAYVLGAVPPYNALLGGKLVSYLLASNEVRTIYRDKYESVQTLIKKRRASDLAAIFTTSLYGANSSQYNRLKYGKRLLYRPIGTTSGYGSLHISQDTFEAMRHLAEAEGLVISNRFGMGPNWRMRVIRSACEILNLDSDTILRHSFQRGLYAVPLVTNFRAFLNGDSETPRYRNLPSAQLVAHWRDRWLAMRKRDPSVVAAVRSFVPEQFEIQRTPIPAYIDSDLRVP